MPVVGQISVGDGATFTPSVSNSGVISWSNDKNLQNPATVDIAGVVQTAISGAYLPKAGGTVTGNLTVNGTITGNLSGNATTATTATTATNATTAASAINDGNGNNIAITYFPAAGGVIGGNTTVSADLTVTGSVSSNNVNVGGNTTVADLSATGNSALTNLSVSGTATFAGTSTAVTPGADDNSTKIATTEYVQTEIKPIEADVSANDKRISNIEKLLQGNLYDYQTDSDSKYVKTVPAGAMPYASLDSVGGRTLVWNQLVVMGNGTSVKNGITYTITSDGTVVINGTSTAIADSAITSFSTNLTIGHVYWLRGCPADASASTYYLNTNNGQCYADGLRFTADSSTSRSIHVRVESGVTANNVTFKVQCTDLTLVFGAGNEPTLEECRTMFPADYPYNAGELVSAGVTEVLSRYKTIVWNQTFDLSILRGDATAYGVTSEKTDNGIRLYGAFTSAINLPVFNSWYGAVIGHKYLIANTPVSEALTLRLTQNGIYVNWQENTPFTATDTHTYLAIRPLTTGVNFDVTWTPQIFDLTLMFGSGNEPATYAEFQQMFPASYYPYNAGTEIPLSVAIKDGVETALQTSVVLQDFSIPAEIRNLEGYGWSARNAYNYIDIERKIFVKNVARVDLGTLAWGSSSSSGKKYFYSSSLSSDIKYVSGSNSIVNNIIYPYGLAGTFFNAYNGVFDCISVGGQGVNAGRIAIYDSTKEEMTNAEFKASVSGVYAYYELATPQEIDISAYLTDDNLISVDNGGTLTFPNSNGTDYQIPVPSAETYMVDLQEAI